MGGKTMLGRQSIPTSTTDPKRLNLTPDEYAKERARRRAKEWRENNRGRDRETKRQYYLNNREKILARQKAQLAEK